MRFLKMSRTCDEADIDYRKQYRAPAGALTMFFGCSCLPSQPNKNTEFGKPVKSHFSPYEVRSQSGKNWA